MVNLRLTLSLRSAHADTVVAVVNHYEPTEKIISGATYALTVKWGAAAG